jgi:hypothetical protein
MYGIFNNNVRPWYHQTILFRDYEWYLNKRVRKYLASICYSPKSLPICPFVCIKQLHSNCINVDKIWQDLLT